MQTSLLPEQLGALTDRLREANSEFAARYPGETGRRQPVHTVYGGAHLFKADTARRLGSLALRALEEARRLRLRRAVGLPGAGELNSSLEKDADLARAWRRAGIVRRVAPTAWMAPTSRARRREAETER